MYLCGLQYKFTATLILIYCRSDENLTDENFLIYGSTQTQLTWDTSWLWSRHKLVTLSALPLSSALRVMCMGQPCFKVLQKENGKTQRNFSYCFSYNCMSTESVNGTYVTTPTKYSWLHCLWLLNDWLPWTQQYFTS